LECALEVIVFRQLLHVLVAFLVIVLKVVEGFHETVALVLVFIIEVLVFHILVSLEILFLGLFVAAPPLGRAILTMGVLAIVFGFPFAFSHAVSPASSNATLSIYNAGKIGSPPITVKIKPRGYFPHRPGIGCLTAAIMVENGLGS
jgi:hypothetical protein